MRFRLRTLLILLAIGPPMLAWVWLCSPAFVAVCYAAAIAMLFLEK
jgi:hypothetical protein